MSNKIFRPFVEKIGNTQASQYVGNEGDLFYDPTSTTLRVSDGETPGGNVLSAGGGANTGNITFEGDFITHVDGGQVGIRLDPNGPVAKMYVDAINESYYSINNENFASAEWVSGEGFALVFNNISSDFSDFINRLQDFKSVSATIRAQGSQIGGNNFTLTVTGFSSNGPNNVGYLYVQENPSTLFEGETSVAFDEINISGVFENRFVLDDDEGDFGIWTDSSIRLNATSDITLNCRDDLRLTGSDAVALRNRSTLEPIQLIANHDGLDGLSSKTWSFYPTGELEYDTFTEQGNPRGRLKWIPNSSGDGNGYTTLELTPDANLETDQKIILDPTVPNHIHIRAGGTPDNSNVSLFLGGEISNVEIASGENPPVFIRANSNTWAFLTNGAFETPSYIRTSPQTVSALGSAADAGVGARWFVVDATATTFASIVAGGGSNPVPVYSDGTDWRIG